ncbi:MAG: AI-2E family transporter [Methanosarcinaceae archaeon]|nr:AI-2E family transporter [Methanosarcinaceae archaeon]
MTDNRQDGISQIISHKWKVLTALALFILVVLMFIVLLPLADGIILGLVFAYICRPIYLALNRYRHFGAFVATMFIVTPMVLIIGIGLFEISHQIIWVIDHQGYVIEILFDYVRIVAPDMYTDQITGLIWDYSLSVLPLIGKLGFVSYARGISMFAINLLISIFVCYFLLVDGDRLYNSIKRIIPKGSERYFDEYCSHFDQILGGVFIGNAYAALSVSSLSVIVFYAFGFSQILALATLVFIASIIPLFAGYMVLVILAILRYFSMGLESALVFFVVASIVIYAPPELFLRPYLAGIRSHIHPMFIMVVFLGGAFVGGIAGFFAAPMLLGSIVAAYRVYVNELDRQESLSEED